MNAKSLLWIAPATFLIWSSSHASVTDIPAWSHSGGIYCYAPILTTDSSTGDQSVALDANQWNFGAMSLTMATDTPSDPTLTINNSINNTSTFDWTGYVVSVAMDQAFSIDAAGVNAPSGWTANITQPGAPVGGIFTGTIDFVGGTPVTISPDSNSILDFGYQLTFSGATQYSLTQTANPVPEPGAFALLLLGMLLFSGWMAFELPKFSANRSA